MGLFDEIGKKIAKSGQDTVKKAKDFAEITKLNGQISEEHRALTAFYAQIGEKYYSLYKDAPQEEFAQSCARISAGLKRIAENQALIQTLKNTKLCPKCGAECEQNVQFCSSCGEKLPMPEPVKPEAPAEAEPAAPCAAVEAPCADAGDAAADGACCETAECCCETVAEECCETAECCCETAAEAAEPAEKPVETVIVEGPTAPAE